MLQKPYQDGKKNAKSSKLEQTILLNRGISIHLERSLTVIEVDRKRMLKFLTRSQKQLRAELKAKKDEKFQLMLKNKMQRTVNGGRRKSEGEVEDDIESALFTNGLVNAPGIHSRMNRLASRRRIMPDLEDSENESDAQQDGSEVSEDEGEKEEKSVQDSHILVNSIDQKSNILNQQNGHEPFLDPTDRKSEAFIWMTSGICSVINQDAKIKQINYEDLKASEKDSAPEIQPAPTITGFSLFNRAEPTANMATSRTNRHSQSRPRNNENEVNRNAIKGKVKTPHFSQNVDLFVFDGADDIVRTSQRNSQSRLSLVKSEIDKNEKEYLMKLRRKSQQQENEDIAKKVWKFIGRKPVSVFTQPNYSYARKNSSASDDILSSEEDDKARKLFQMAANRTRQEPDKNVD